MTKTQHVNSFYAASVASRLVDYPRLAGDIRADVCVLGGGFAGLSTALHLAQKGTRVVLLERNRVGWGASGRNGGHMESLFGHDPDDFEKPIGADRASGMWELSSEACRLVGEIIARNAIECDMRKGVGHVAHKPKHAEHLRLGAEKFLARGYRKNVKYYDRAELADLIGTEAYYGGFFDMDMVHLNPLQFAVGFAKVVAQAGVQIFEDSDALSYDASGAGVKVRTATGTVMAEKLIIATNANIHRIDRHIAQKIFNAYAWVIATEPLGSARAAALMKERLAVNDTRMFIDFYRLSGDNRLVFGSVSPISLDTEEKRKHVLRKRMLAIYPELADVQIDYAWEGKGAADLKFLPHIGEASPKVYYTLASNVAWAVLNGQLIAEALHGDRSRFELVAGIETPAVPIGVRGREALVDAYKLYERTLG
ncbi:MAG TPA: FAD-binding oxidoreductase [Novosphingobium sp.]|nr:FAD-binding oxidoreductase [Novosphingobium sp.]HZV11384.1 FAD-binding oxidoreductase [Novosphingobium sp.]